MSATQESSGITRSVGFHPAPIVLLIAAGGLFIASALLQQRVSLQLWDAFTGPVDGAGADPVAALAAAARTEGIATGLTALGILSVAAGLLALPRTGRRRIPVVAGAVSATLAAASFAVPAALSMVGGMPAARSLSMDPAFPTRMLMLVGMLGLVAAAIWWRGTSIPVAIACVLLLGSTALGDFVANIFIAPLLADHPWSQSPGWSGILALASTAAAGISMLYAAGRAAWRHRRTN